MKQGSPEGRQGKALARNLTTLQRRYARCRADGIGTKEAAAAAGYTMTTPNDLYVAAHRLEKHPGVQAEIARLKGERQLEYLCAMGVAGRALCEIILDKDHPDRLEAVLHTLKLGGVLPEGYAPPDP